MTQAIFGLLGVLIGGCITASVQWAARRADDHRREAVGTRGLLHDLVMAHAVIGAAADLKSLGGFDSWPDLAKSWETHGGALAASDWRTWSVISNAVLDANSLVMIGAIRDRRWDTGLDETMRDTEGSLDDAIRVLRIRAGSSE